MEEDPITREILLTYVEPAEAKKFSQMDFTEKKYYKLIKSAGVMGLTSQELKN